MIIDTGIAISLEHLQCVNLVSQKSRSTLNPDPDPLLRKGGSEDPDPLFQMWIPGSGSTSK